MTREPGESGEVKWFAASELKRQGNRHQKAKTKMMPRSGQFSQTKFHTLKALIVFEHRTCI